MPCNLCGDVVCAHLQVRVLVPDSKGGRIEVAVLGRGQFVGERSVINDKLRSADCVAQGRVQVCVLILSVLDAYSRCLFTAGLRDGLIRQSNWSLSEVHLAERMVLLQDSRVGTCATASSCSAKLQLGVHPYVFN